MRQIATLPESVARPAIILTTSALDLQTRNDRRVLPAARIATPAGAEDLLAVEVRHGEIQDHQAVGLGGGGEELDALAPVDGGVDGGSALG